MKKVRNEILIALDRGLNRAGFIHTLGLHFYHLLFRGMRFYFLKKYSSLLDIQLRHSANQQANFNLFYSDIDSTFIVDDENDFEKIIQSFRKFQHLFPMFDMPEFYTRQEGLVLHALSSEALAPYLKVAWNLRKLNWIKKTKFNDRYEELKQLRAFKKSYAIVFQCSRRKNDVYYLNEINFFNRHLSNSASPHLCSYSFYLDTTTKDCLKLLGTCDDFIKFNALMPGEEQPDLLDTKELVIKHAIEAREQLIAHTSIRVAKALNKKLSDLENWNAFLDGRNSMAHFLN